MKVLINGAGLAGLAMARALSKFCPAIAFEIIEVAPQLRTTGASIAIPGNGVEGLSYLSLLPSLMDIAVQVNKIRYLKYDGELLSEASLIDGPPLSNYPFVALQRKELIAFLAKDLMNRIQFNTTIKQHRVSGNAVQLTLSNGKELQADLVIDASGVNSNYREQICGKDLREDLGLTCWRFLTERKTENPSYYLLQPRGGVGLLYPTTDNQSYVYLQRGEPLANFSEKVEQTDLLNFFDDFVPAFHSALKSVNPQDIIASRLTSVSKPILTDHRHTAFIGDAAAACSPQLQQGFAGAAEDALTLAWCLASQKQLSQALALYEKLRLPRVQWVTESSDIPLKNFSINNTAVTRDAIAQKIKQGGPLNVQGWCQLFQEDYLKHTAQHLGH